MTLQTFQSNCGKYSYAFDTEHVNLVETIHGGNLIVGLNTSPRLITINVSEAPELVDQIFKALNSDYEISSEPKPDYVWKKREGYSYKSEVCIKSPKLTELRKVLVKLKELEQDDECQVTGYTWNSTDCTVKVFFSEWYSNLTENIAFLESVLGPQSA